MHADIGQGFSLVRGGLSWCRSAGATSRTNGGISITVEEGVPVSPLWVRRRAAQDHGPYTSEASAREADAQEGERVARTRATWAAIKESGAWLRDWGSQYKTTNSDAADLAAAGGVEIVQGTSGGAPAWFTRGYEPPDYYPAEILQRGVAFPPHQWSGGRSADGAVMLLASPPDTTDRVLLTRVVQGDLHGRFEALAPSEGVKVLESAAVGDRRQVALGFVAVLPRGGTLVLEERRRSGVVFHQWAYPSDAPEGAIQYARGPVLAGASKTAVEAF